MSAVAAAEMPGIGHNQEPTTLDAIKKRIDELTATADRWITERPEITDAAMAAKADDFITQVSGELSAVEKARVAEKEPHLEAGRAVDAVYNPLKRPLELMKEKLGTLRKAWLAKEQKRIDEERAKAAQAAAEAQRLADEAAAKLAESAAPSIGAMLAAEQAQQEAADAAKAAEAIPVKASVKGAYAGRATSLRTTWKARVKNIGAAFMTYRDHPEVKELLERLASAEARGGVRTLAGFEIYSEEN